MLPPCSNNIFNDKERTRKGMRSLAQRETPVLGSVRAGVGVVGGPGYTVAAELTSGLQGPLQLHESLLKSSSLVMESED